MEAFFSLLVIGLIVLIIVSSIFKRGGESSTNEPRAEYGAAGTIKGRGTYEQEVVGESKYQDALEKAVCLAGKSTPCFATAMLIKEGNNQHDQNAVRVMINGSTVGYLPKTAALQYRKYLDGAGVPDGNYLVSARVYGGGEKLYGVWLDINFE